MRCPFSHQSPSPINWPRAHFRPKTALGPPARCVEPPVDQSSQCSMSLLPAVEACVALRRSNALAFAVARGPGLDGRPRQRRRHSRRGRADVISLALYRPSGTGSSARLPRASVWRARGWRLAAPVATGRPNRCHVTSLRYVVGSTSKEREGWERKSRLSMRGGTPVGAMGPNTPFGHATYPTAARLA